MRNWERESVYASIASFVEGRTRVHVFINLCVKVRLPTFVYYYDTLFAYLQCACYSMFTYSLHVTVYLLTVCISYIVCLLQFTYYSLFT